MPMRPNRPIYLDNHATTPVDPRVLAAMRPWWEENFANPHSVEHAMGREAEEAVEAARAEIADADRRRGARGGADLGRHRSQQPGDQGRRPLRRATGQRAPADRHPRHRAQMRPGKRPRPGGRGLRAGAAAGRAGRAGRPRPAAGGGRRPHPAGQRHGGEQRDRRGAGPGRDRRHRQGSRRAVPHRRGAGLRAYPAGRGGRSRPTCCRSPATRSTGRRASARSMSAAGRGCGWRRCSPAAGRSAASAPAPCRRRWWWGSARRRGSRRSRGCWMPAASPASATCFLRGAGGRGARASRVNGHRDQPGAGQPEPDLPRPVSTPRRSCRRRRRSASPPARPVPRPRSSPPMCSGARDSRGRGAGDLADRDRPLYLAR